jgi:hypothetical protein
MNTIRKPRRWTQEQIDSEIRLIAAAIGYFPAASELRSMGRNDLICAITKREGSMALSSRLGIPRRHSDSDTGWDGELAFQALAIEAGFDCQRADACKAPFDLILDGSLRIDVKAASFAEYSESRGWFYRLGKIVQADVVVFYQLDTKNFYAVPWYLCPTSNVTISRSGGRYIAYKNNWELLRKLTATRSAERSQLHF